MKNEIKGWHVFATFVFVFCIIIAVNGMLAFKAIETFPGLEVKNSYVASQTFEKYRSAQLSLDWEVTASLDEGLLYLVILENGHAISPTINQAIFGRPTSVASDQRPVFIFDGSSLVAPVEAENGNWNLRLKARAANGALFQQRIVVQVRP